jgi:hypothetical protein
VDEGDRLAAEAFFERGLEAERKARADYKKKKDIRFNVREAEKDYFKESFEERRRKALESLETEFQTRKKYLEDKKKKLLSEYDENPTNKKELRQELSSIDFQIEENNKLKIREETEYVSSMSKRAKMDKYSTFEYEDWMDSVLETHVVENMFDFPRIVKLIQLDFKNKNVKNWELFNELDLRTKWTEIELKKFRKDEARNYNYYFEERNEDDNNETAKPMEPIMSMSKIMEIKEGTIDENEYGNKEQKFENDNEELINTNIEVGKNNIVNEENYNFNDLD